MKNTKNTVPLNELTPTQAVAVQAIGTIEVKEGEVVLVGVKCVWDGQRYTPITDSFKCTQNMFAYCDPGEVVVIKRIANI